MEEMDLNSSDFEISKKSPPGTLKIVKSKPPKVPPKPCKSRQSIASCCSFTSLNDSLTTPDLLNNNLTFWTTPDYPVTEVSQKLENEAPSLPLPGFNVGSQDKLDTFELIKTDFGLKGSKPLMTSHPIDINNPAEPNASSFIENNGLFDCYCPFYKLHHTTPCEFLSLPQIADEDKSLFLGIDDLSSKTDDKIKFIVANLKMCGGIWPLMFMEKLNRLIVHADYKAVKSCLHEDDFSLIYKLVKLYAEEQRCSVVFRYWCTFYNILSRNLVPYPVFVNSELVDLLKKDFITGTNGLCRCKGEACLFDSLPLDTLDEEHTIICPKIQIQITSILLIPLFTARAGLKLSYDLASETEFILQVLKIIDEEDQMSFRISKDMSPRDEATNGKNILVHLLLAYNLQFPTKSHENPMGEAVAVGTKEFGGLSVFKAKLLTIFLQEVDSLNRGCLDGISSLISQTAPLGLQTSGVNGPLKLFIDLNNSDTSEFFDIEDLKFIRTWSKKIQKIISSDGFWDDKTEEIFSNSRMLQDLLDLKIRNFPSEVGSKISGGETGSDQDIKLPVYLPNANSSSDWGSSDDNLLNAEDNEKLSSNYSLAKKSKDGFLKPKIVMWPVEVVMKCFGCSKRKSSVSPASKSDVDQGLI